MYNCYKNNYYNKYYYPEKKSQTIYTNMRASQSSHPSPSNTSNVPQPHPPPCKPPPKKKIPPKKKFSFKSLKKDTCTSLNDVECFLNNFSNFIKYVKIINLLK